MTLALVDDTHTTRRPTRTRVCVLVLTRGQEPGLGVTIDALAAQTQAPDRVLVIDADATPEASSPSSGGDSVGQHASEFGAALHARLGTDIPVAVRPAGATALRAAVRVAAADLTAGEVAGVVAEAHDDWLVWVLVPGSVPEPAALAQLLDAYRRSSSVGIVGPKLVDAADPLRLRSVGISATAGGRIVDDPRDGAPDQGQYDQRHDVLAVPVAGALIDASLIASLKGWERSFGDVAADLDFGWRAQRRGRRVLVVPRARVHVPPGHGLSTATTPARRRAGRRVALTRSSWWGAFWLALWLSLGSLLMSVVLLLLKRPRAAGATFGDIFSVNPVSVAAARWRTRGRSSVRRADVRGLFVSGETVRRGIADQVHEALVPRAVRSDDAPRDSRSTAVRVLTHPGLLATVAVAAIWAAAGRTLGLGFLTGIGGGPTGGELFGGRISSSALWHAWVDSWSGAGLGSNTHVGGPHLALLALPTWVVEHMPGLSGLASPGGLVLGLVLVLGPLLATAVGYTSARVLTLRRWPRAAAALAWGVLPPVTEAYAAGRLGAVVAHVLLPAVLAGIVLLARRDGTATAAWATALGAGVLGAFAPVSLAFVAVICGVLVIAAPGVGARLRALVPLVVPAALLGPWLAAAAADPRLLLAGPGLTSWGGTTPEPWETAVLQLGGVDLTHWWVLVPVGIVAVLGLAGLGRGGLRSTGSGIVVALVLALAWTLVTPRILLGSVPESLPDAGSAITPWVGLPMMTVVLVLLAGGLWGLGTPVSSSQGRRVVAAGGWLMALAAAGAAVLLVLAGVGTALEPWRDPRPAVAVEHTQGDVAGRALFVTPDETGAAYRIMSREITDVARSLPIDRSDDAAIAPMVTALLSGHEGAGTDLAGSAIGIIGITEGADPELTRTVDATEGLTRLVARDGWNYWRVSATGLVDERPVAPSRLELRVGDGGDVVPTLGQHAATVTEVDAPDGAQLRVAEPIAWADHATVMWGETVLTADRSGDHLTYALPTGSAPLTITVDDAHPVWRLAQWILIGVVIFLAVPFGSRASRRQP